MNQKDSLNTLSDIQRLIKNTLEQHINGFYWISAEISELKINYSGHCYLELIEKDKNDTIRAKSRAIIWSAKSRMLLPYFKNTAGIPLKEGIKVLVRAKVEYHEIYGLSLIIYDIDPTFTMGDMAIRRKQIINRLQSEGVFDLNKDLPFPLHSNRIAVISSDKAAGYQDFSNELDSNQYGYKFYTDLFRSTMQGNETEKSVCSAINEIFEKIENYDLIVIVRGGGSQSDLSWFDNYNIAYLISQSPIPVLTGIGHEKDMSVTDLVAYKSFKTPTAVAGFIIDHILKTDEYLLQLKTDLINLSRELVNSKRSIINRISINMSPAVRSDLKDKRSMLSQEAMRLSGNVRSLLSFHRSRLETHKTVLKKESFDLIKFNRKSIETYSGKLKPTIRKHFKEKHLVLDNISKSIHYLSPERVLERGYSITRFNNKTLRSSNEIYPDSEIITILSKGSIKSKVIDLKKPDK